MSSIQPDSSTVSATDSSTVALNADNFGTNTSSTEADHVTDVYSVSDGETNKEDQTTVIANTASETVTSNSEQTTDPTRGITVSSQFTSSSDSDNSEVTATVIPSTEISNTTNDVSIGGSSQSSTGSVFDEVSTKDAEQSTPQTTTSAVNNTTSPFPETTRTPDAHGINTRMTSEISQPTSTEEVSTSVDENNSSSYAVFSSPQATSWPGVSYTTPALIPQKSTTTLMPPYSGFSIESVSDAVPLIVACVTSTFVLGSIAFVICIICCRRCRDSKESYSTMERRPVIDAYETNQSPSVNHSSRTLPLRNMKPRPTSNAGIIMAFDNQIFNNTFPRRPPPPPKHLPPSIPDYQNYNPGGAHNGRPGMLPKQYLPDPSRSLPRQSPEDLHKGRLSLAKGKARPSDVRPYALDQPSYATLPSNRIPRHHSIYLEPPQRNFNQSSC